MYVINRISFPGRTPIVRKKMIWVSPAAMKPRKRRRKSGDFCSPLDPWNAQKKPIRQSSKNRPHWIVPILIKFTRKKPVDQIRIICLRQIALRLRSLWKIGDIASIWCNESNTVRFWNRFNQHQKPLQVPHIWGNHTFRKESFLIVKNYA